MTRGLIFTLLVVGCRSAPTAPTAPESGATPFAVAYLSRMDAAEAPAPENQAETDVPAPIVKRVLDEVRGLLESSPKRRAELKRIARNDGALSTLLRQPISRTDLETLAWLRSPAVQAAREQYEAARTQYQQSSDLKDLVTLYRSYLRETKTRVGPEKSRRATASIAPYPNIDALSGELVERSVAIAFEKFRQIVRDTIADAERAHADAARLAAARRIVEADVALHDSLVRVLRVRLEAGRSTQAAVLAFQSRLEGLSTELAVLQQQQSVVRATWNRLINRSEQAPVNIDVEAPAPQTSADAPRLVALASQEQQALRIAKLVADRASIAVRLAETMTLPRLDLGSSRFERERAGEAGVQHGSVFPKPGRMMPPRSDFGVREAQVGEMRARARAADRSFAAAKDSAQASVRSAWFAFDAAARRWTVHMKDVVPLAERAFESTRGAYEGNRTGYIELLDGARRLLRARLALVDARRDISHGRAQILRAVGIRTASKR